MQVTTLPLCVACRSVAKVMAGTHAAEECVTYVVTSRNDRRGVASGVLCGSASRLCDLTDRAQLDSECSAIEYSGVK
jgi:hypothetical protein